VGIVYTPDAKRQGFILLKSRRCAPLAPDSGAYSLVDSHMNTLAVGNQRIDFGLTLDQVERLLSRGRPTPGENA